MAYLPHTYVPIGSSGTKRTKYTLPYGGVRLSDDRGVTPVGNCRKLTNMEPKNGRIETRRAQTAHKISLDGQTLNGSIKKPHFGYLIFHVDKKLYALGEKSNEPVCISQDLPDEKSLMCTFMSKLYIYCDYHIFSLDRDLVLKEEEPTPAYIFSSCTPGIQGNGTRLDAPFNILAPRVKVSFVSSDARYFNMPFAIDLTRPYQVYNDGVLMNKSAYEISETLITVGDGIGLISPRTISIVYYLRDLDKAGFDRVLEGCSLVSDYGGKASGGTRLFFTGNPERPGCYFKSEFLDPLYCASDNFETVGDGSSNITSLIKMYGNLMIFTEGSVYKMSYTLTNDGAFFSTKQISDYVGCDCPDSLQIIDNRAVFLNSKRGVFIIDSTDEAGEHNIKPLSGNVLKDGISGLLDMEPDVLKKAESCDFDRKYMLFAGGRVYVWDYDKTAFYESNSYSKAQDRLCWYIYDGFEGENFCGFGTRLVSFSVENENAYLYEFPSSDAAVDLEAVLESGNMEEFSDGKRRFVTGMGIKLSRNEACDVTLAFYADGTEYFTKTLHKRESTEEKIMFSLPRKALYDFGFKATVKGACGIDAVEFLSREISE